MERRDFLIQLTSAAIGLSCLHCGQEPKTKRPNIIFIMADDLGYGGLGCYGAKQIPTPNCDLLAAEGIRFTDAHSASAVCSPTRYSVLTGRYAWRSWLKNWVLMEHMPLLIETDRLTVPKLLKQHGYATGCIGKWHLGWGDHIHPDWNEKLQPGPQEIGFDRFFGVPFSHNSSAKLQVFVENDRIVGLKPGEQLDNEDTLERVQRRLKDTATRLSKEAVDFIDINKDRPFFLYYPTTNVHVPHTPHERFEGKSTVGKYGDFVAEFDWAVGEILSTLDRLQLTENTLVIVTSDNGAWTNPDWTINNHKPNGNWRGEKATIYEGGHRIPFIARWPGNIQPDTVCDELICLTDLMATCAALVSEQLPASAGEDSANILPALLGKELRQPLHKNIVHHSVSGMFAIRKGPLKLIDGVGDGYRPTDWPTTQKSGIDKPEWDKDRQRFKDVNYFWPTPKPKLNEPPGQLYNLETDPGETENVWNQYPEIVKQLKHELDRVVRS